MDKRWEHGWYATECLQAESFYLEGNRRAWMPSRSGEPATFPTTMHVPYNNREPADVYIQSYSSWLQQNVEELSQILEDQHGFLI